MIHPLIGPLLVAKILDIGAHSAFRGFALKMLECNREMRINMRCLRLISNRGFHNVYVPLSGPKLALKIPCHYARRAAVASRSYELLLNSSKYCVRMNRDFATLSRFVGSQACVESLWIVAIPVSTDGRFEAPVPIMIQPWDAYFESQARVCISARYLELDAEKNISEKNARQINSMLLGRCSPDLNLISESYPWVKVIRNAVLRDPFLKDQVESILYGFGKFTSCTGRLLDLTGRDNLIVINDNGWKIRIGSIIKEDKTKCFRQSLADIANQNYMINKLSREIVLNLINGLAMTRAMNAMAISIGSDFWLDINLNSSGIEMISSLQFFNTIRSRV